MIACARVCDMKIQTAIVDEFLCAFNIAPVFSQHQARDGSAMRDPPFRLSRSEGCLTQSGLDFDMLPALKGTHVAKNLSSRDVIHQYPGWAHPGKHILRVSFECPYWHHRERRWRKENII